ncbi:hypothetical protein [Arcobacter sp.]|jgi:hypothetical protein|uniref:hypothetical protein n=1 Tax=Arcobacter sp. TaxID=1872629 RepID=UPI003C72368B|tara:strand:+ start:1095 stop:1379 length:285 start_codon:yes stop_codon:yes gene_type:complete
MKIKFLLLTIFTIITFASSSYLSKDTKIDEKLYSRIINTPIENLSGVFKIHTKNIIKKLTDNNIKILNKEQTIIQIALSNSKDSNEIIDLILSN